LQLAFAVYGNENTSQYYWLKIINYGGWTTKSEDRNAAQFRGWDFPLTRPLSFSLQKRTHAWRAAFLIPNTE
jgi:hypothetical protein